MDQVISSPYTIPVNEFVSAYFYYPSEWRGKLNSKFGKNTVHFMEMILFMAISLAYEGLMASDASFNSARTILIFIGLNILRHGFTIIQSLKINKEKEERGYLSEECFVQIEPEKITAHYLDKKLEIAKESIKHIRKTKSEFLVFYNTDKLLIIPLKSIKDEEQKFIQCHYFVHYM